MEFHLTLGDSLGDRLGSSIVAATRSEFGDLINLADELHVAILVIMHIHFNRAVELAAAILHRASPDRSPSTVPIVLGIKLFGRDTNSDFCIPSFLFGIYSTSALGVESGDIVSDGGIDSRSKRLTRLLHSRFCDSADSLQNVIEFEYLLRSGI